MGFFFLVAQCVFENVIKLCIENPEYFSSSNFREICICFVERLDMKILNIFLMNS